MKAVESSEVFVQEFFLKNITLSGTRPVTVMLGGAPFGTLDAE